jgi:hypothetical protein
MEHTPILVHHSINHRVSRPAIFGLNVEYFTADLNVRIESGTHAGIDARYAARARSGGELKVREFI